MPNELEMTTTKAEVILPKGLDADKVQALLNSAVKNTIITKLRDKATRDAFAALKKAHEPEFTKLLNVELKKVDLPTK